MAAILTVPQLPITPLSPAPRPAARRAPPLPPGLGVRRKVGVSRGSLAVLCSLLLLPGAAVTVHGQSSVTRVLSAGSPRETTGIQQTETSRARQQGRRRRLREGGEEGAAPEKEAETQRKKQRRAHPGDSDSPQPARCEIGSPGISMATTATCTRFTDEYQLYEELGK